MKALSKHGRMRQIFGVALFHIISALSAAPKGRKESPYFNLLLGGGGMPFDASVDGMTEGVNSILLPPRRSFRLPLASRVAARRICERLPCGNRCAFYACGSFSHKSFAAQNLCGSPIREGPRSFSCLPPRGRCQPAGLTEGVTLF